MLQRRPLQLTDNKRTTNGQQTHNISTSRLRRDRALVPSCTRATNTLGANLEHGDIVLDREGDHSMPTLRNPRHERFAQGLATGKTADAAYGLAGYRENRSNAARLSANQDIQKRVAEIQSLGAELAAITVETLIAEAEAARSKAMAKRAALPLLLQQSKPRQSSPVCGVKR